MVLLSEASPLILAPKGPKIEGASAGECLRSLIGISLMGIPNSIYG